MKPAGPHHGERISRLFSTAEAGDRGAAEALFTALYDQLHRLARRQLARNAADLTLGTTTLLHEAYLDMMEREGVAFPDRPRFMAYAARVMRSVVIDYARSRKALKRGGGFELTTLTGEPAAVASDHAELARLSDALDALAVAEPALAQVVDLKFFCGFSFAEIAALQASSERTVQRHWEKARIYLHGTLHPGGPSGGA